MIAADPVLVVAESLNDVRKALEDDFIKASQWIQEVVSSTDRTKSDTCEVCDRRVIPEDLEVHHVAGRRYGNWTITVCKKCHAKLSMEQKSWDRRWNVSVSGSESVYFLLRGLIDVLSLKFMETGKQCYRELSSQILNRMVNF